MALSPTPMRPHPVQMVDRFLKLAASELPKAFGVGDASKAMRRAVPNQVQSYSKPNIPAAQTRPETIESQKAVPPPSM